jgi:hypothetical protein
MLSINFKVIPHKEQRYETFGDYWWDESGVLQARISDIGDDDMHFAGFLHEVFEAYSTNKKGVKEPDIMAFDEMFNKETDEGLHKIDDEPGEDPRAPYKEDHLFANVLEKLAGIFLKVDEQEYQRRVTKLFEKDK